MAPRRQRTKSSEFPVLEANALYAGEIRGDGNCLFNALSDQLYGHQEMHEVLRTATIEHMRENAEFYRQYMVVNSVRRNPKRKSAAATATRIDTGYYTEEQLQQQFEEHVEKMGQPGEWADNMEVSAFASALNVHVRLWQADYTYLFSPRIYYDSGNDSNAVDDLKTLHVAYHSWEHYSSVRKLAGPHTGLPDVHVVPAMISKKRTSPSVDGGDDDQHRRARKRRSPLPLFDSDSTPEGTESSSDESNGPVASQQSSLDIPLPEENVKPQKLTLKLRGLRTADLTDSPSSSRASTPAPTAVPVASVAQVATPSMDATTTAPVQVTAILTKDTTTPPAGEAVASMNETTTAPAQVAAAETTPTSGQEAATLTKDTTTPPVQEAVTLMNDTTTAPAQVEVTSSLETAITPAQVATAETSTTLALEAVAETPTTSTQEAAALTNETTTTPA